MSRDHRLTEVVESRSERGGRDVFVGHHALQHEPAIGCDVCEELPFAELVVVRQQAEQSRSRNIGR